MKRRNYQSELLELAHHLRDKREVGPEDPRCGEEKRKETRSRDEGCEGCVNSSGVTESRLVGRRKRRQRERESGAA